MEIMYIWLYPIFINIYQFFLSFLIHLFIYKYKVKGLSKLIILNTQKRHLNTFLFASFDILNYGKSRYKAFNKIILII